MPFYVKLFAPKVRQLSKITKITADRFDIETFPENGRDFFDSYNNEVVSYFERRGQRDRVLVWSVGQGWEPLCNFLGIPVPKIPFPHSNDTTTMDTRRKNQTKMVRRAAIKRLGRLLVFTVLTGVAVYAGRKVLGI